MLLQLEQKERKTHEKRKKQADQGSVGTDSRHGGRTGEPSDDSQIGGVEKLLKHGTRCKRQCEEHDPEQDRFGVQRRVHHGEPERLPDEQLGIRKHDKVKREQYDGSETPRFHDETGIMINS